MSAAQLNVTPAQAQTIKAILKQHVPEFEVWAFGSRTTSKAKPYSDLDLVIMTTQPLPIEQLANLKEAFSESDLPWKVDLVDWAATQSHFREIIEPQKVVIQTI